VFKTLKAATFVMSVIHYEIMGPVLVCISQNIHPRWGGSLEKYTSYVLIHICTELTDLEKKLQV
jgi:hypothetical protein